MQQGTAGHRVNKIKGTKLDENSNEFEVAEKITLPGPRTVFSTVEPRFNEPLYNERYSMSRPKLQ